MRWQRNLVVAGTLAALGAASLAGVAAADITEPPGRCVGTASFQRGAGDGPFTVDSQRLSPDDVVTVPLKDTVTWSGELVGVSPATRQISGYVKVDLPPPLPDLTIDSWDGPSALTANQGTRNYSLPSVTPRGVEFRVYGSHSEAGAVFCTGSAKVKVEGSAIANPITIASLVLLAASAVPLVLAGKGKPGLGGFMGFLLGLFLGLSLMLLGVLPLNSALITILPLAGVIGGVVWGKLALLARAAA